MTGQMVSLYSAGTPQSGVAFKPKVYKGKEQHREGKGSPRVFEEVLLFFVHAFNIYVRPDVNVSIISPGGVKASLVCFGVLQTRG